MWQGFWYWFHEGLRWPLFHEKRGALALLCEALARELDHVRRDCIFVRNQYNPQTCMESLVAVHGAARGINRLTGENLDDFRIRAAQAFAWQRLGGGQQGLPIILDAHGFPGVQVENMRAQNPVRWAEFDLVLEEPERQDVFLQQVEWLITLANEYKPARSLLRSVRINSPLYSCRPLRLDASRTEGALDKEYMDRAAGIFYGDVLLCYPALESSEGVYLPSSEFFWAGHSAYYGLVPYTDRPFLDLWKLDSALLEATQIVVSADDLYEIMGINACTDLYTRKNISRSQAVCDDRVDHVKRDALDGINYRLDHPARVKVSPWRLDAPDAPLDDILQRTVRIYDEFFAHDSATELQLDCAEQVFWLNRQQDAEEKPTQSACGFSFMALSALAAAKSGSGVGNVRLEELSLDNAVLDQASLHGDPSSGVPRFAQTGLCPSSIGQVLPDSFSLCGESQLSDWAQRVPPGYWQGKWDARPWFETYGYWLESFNTSIQENA